MQACPRYEPTQRPAYCACGGVCTDCLRLSTVATGDVREEVGLDGARLVAVCLLLSFNLMDNFCLRRALSTTAEFSFQQDTSGAFLADSIAAGTLLFLNRGANIRFVCTDGAANCVAAQRLIEVRFPGVFASLLLRPTQRGPDS